MLDLDRGKDWFPDWSDPIIVFFCECGMYWSELEDQPCPCDYVPFPTTMNLQEYVAADAPRWVIFA